MLGLSLRLEGSTSEELKQAWGDWLSSLASWEWFVTMTFKDPEGGLDGTWTKPGWGHARRAWEALVARARPGLGELTWVRMFELQGWRGVPHIHGLVAGVDPTVRRLDLVDWAWGAYGMTRVLPYDPARGARFYLCKYVTKDLADIDFSPGLTRGT